MSALVRLLRWLIVWPDPQPTDAPPRSWLAWLGGTVQGLFGLASWQKTDGSRRHPLVWLLRSVQGLVVRVALFLLLLGGAIYLLLRGSLPDLDGTRTVPGLQAAVRIERDHLGIPTIHAENRPDLFFGLGYVHGQERFFQMDLSRRFASGELAALLGPAIVQADEYTRPLRLRQTARALVERLSTPQRTELDAYVAGINAGLQNLSVRPPEYLALQTLPEAWTAEDSCLVLLAVVITLQDDNWRIERYRAVAHATLPDSLYRLIDARGTTEWDAPLVGGPIPTPRLPTADEFDLRKEPRSGPRLLGALPQELPILGSNNWAVAGSETRQGRAILANDMHLELRVPTIWYRAGLAWNSGRDGQPMKAWGASYPGTPGLVVGSNQHVAWGLTNAEVDTADLVAVERDPQDERRYRTPDGFEPFERFDETIHVRGGEDQTLPVLWTRWGPLLSDDRNFALHWVAHAPRGLNFGWLDILETRTLDEALAAANRTGGPHQNFVAADTTGAIGWTILGALPRRVGFDGRLPVSWADGKCRWDGFLPPEQTPRVVRPASGRLWTANNRVVGDPALALLGEAGYDRGARAGQIRDALRAMKQPDEADLFALALDDRALFLARWRDLLLKVLEKADLDDPALLAWMRHEVASSADRADIDRIGYRLVTEFRDQVSADVMEPLVQRCRLAAPDFNLGYFRQREGAVWEMVTKRPAHLLSPTFASWDDLLSRAAIRVAQQAQHSPEGLAGYTWGARNVSRIEHPLGAGLAKLPYVGPWLASCVNMPRLPLPGAFTDMPRVQGISHGASERMAVSPGHEEEGYFHMPCGQSGHFLSPHYRDMHAAWCEGRPTPFLPGPTVHTLTLQP